MFFTPVPTPFPPVIPKVKVTWKAFCAFAFIEKNLSENRPVWSLPTTIAGLLGAPVTLTQHSRVKSFDTTWTAGPISTAVPTTLAAPVPSNDIDWLLAAPVCGTVASGTSAERTALLTKVPGNGPDESNALPEASSNRQ